MSRTLTAHARLARWLHEWDLDQQLRAAFPAPAVPPPGATAQPATDQPAPAVGDIRLLPPVPLDGSAAWERPVYVALLAAPAAGRFLLAPFGRFTVPATPEEWSTGLRPPALRVLCLWAARTVPAAVAGASWQADRLSPACCRAALAKPLPAARCGPPAGSPADPRWRYLAEEAALFDELLALPHAASHPGQPTSLVYTPPAPEFGLAAEPPPDDEA